MGTQILLIEQYGAAGDGVTDDGAAIRRALDDAIELHAILRFTPGKTYLVRDIPNGEPCDRNAIFSLHGADGVLIDGCGALFLAAPGMTYFSLTGCKNVALTRCRFDYAKPVYLVGTVAQSDGETVIFDIDLEPYCDSYDFAPVNGFSIAYNPGVQNRPHRFMGACERIGERRLRVTYRGEPGYAPGDLVFLPNPGIGHHFGEMSSLNWCENARLEEVSIHAAPTFTMAVRGNRGDICFDDVRLVPNPDHPRALRMVAWRDGFHCKDNRGSLHWSRCRADVLFDDVFNVRCTLGIVTDVQPDSVAITNLEFYNRHQIVGFDADEGDLLDLYDLETGDYYGCAEVESAAPNPDGTRCVRLKSMPEGVRSGAVAANRALGAPGSTIDDSVFTGTFRFTRGMTVRNTIFDQLITWIMVEGDVEGPLPGDLRFEKCAFNGGVVQIDAYNRQTSQYMPAIGRQIGGITFEDCTFNSSEIENSSSSSYILQNCHIL